MAAFLLSMVKSAITSSISPVFTVFQLSFCGFCRKLAKEGRSDVPPSFNLMSLFSSDKTYEANSLPLHHAHLLVSLMTMGFAGKC